MNFPTALTFSVFHNTVNTVRNVMRFIELRYLRYLSKNKRTGLKVSLE